MPTELLGEVRPTGAPPAHNGARLVTTRTSAVVAPAQLNQVVDPGGRLVGRPGQGGVVVAPGLRERAGGWESDHLEPGASLVHEDPAASRALQVLACVGNVVHVVAGPAAGARGVVYGKHGAVLAQLERPDLLRLRPGDQLVVDARGCGLRLQDVPDVAVRSCSPEVLESLVVQVAGDPRLHVGCAAVLPAEAAAAGIGMPSDAYNVDLEMSVDAWSENAKALRLGDVVVLDDHDHTHGREHRDDWVAVGVLVHGQSVGGGHGFGMTTLLSGPRDRFVLYRDAEARLGPALARGSR